MHIDEHSALSADMNLTDFGEEEDVKSYLPRRDSKVTQLGGGWDQDGRSADAVVVSVNSGNTGGS